MDGLIISNLRDPFLYFTIAGTSLTSLPVSSWLPSSIMQTFFPASRSQSRSGDWSCWWASNGCLPDFPGCQQHLQRVSREDYSPQGLVVRSLQVVALSGLSSVISASRMTGCKAKYILCPSSQVSSHISSMLSRTAWQSSSWGWWSERYVRPCQWIIPLDGANSLRYQCEVIEKRSGMMVLK